MPKNFTAQLALAAALAVLGTLPSQAADVMNGSRLYSMHCIACHGVKGQALLPNAPSFARGERLMQPDMMLMMTMRTGKGAMPAFMGILRDQEMLDVISYIRTLQFQR